MHHSSRATIAALALVVVCMLGVVGLYAFFVQSSLGQELDRAAFAGAEVAWPWGSEIAFATLDVISILSIAAAVVLILVIAIARRRWAIAVASAVVIAGANATTQVLKGLVFTRPALAGESWFSNSLPSGHTTVAASISLALLIVVPTAARSAVAVLGVIATCATGISTLIQQWHRPSDAVAAVLVATGWAALVVAIGGSRITAATVAAPGGRQRFFWANRKAKSSVVTVVLAVIGGLGAIAAVGSMLFLANDRAGLTVESARNAAYVSGMAGLVSAAMLAFSAVLSLITLESRSGFALKRSPVTHGSVETR